MQFCHISPTPHLDDFCRGRPTHLLLAHLVEEDEKYRDWYKREKERNPGTVYILDCSAFEMFKRGLPMFPSEKLLDLAQEIKADYVVMSDFPGHASIVTIESAIKLAGQFKMAGFGTFYCPQSEIGDLEDLVKGFQWGFESELVDYIGFSILAIPNAYGVERDNKLQRFLARWRFMNTPVIADMLENSTKKIHMLGMVDGPNEIVLLKDQIKYIDTWDSSAAVWAGLNGILFDLSPTGLVNGKFEKEVDFNFKINYSKLIEMAQSNVDYIDTLAALGTVVGGKS